MGHVEILLAIEMGNGGLGDRLKQDRRQSGVVGGTAFRHERRRDRLSRGVCAL